MCVCGCDLMGVTSGRPHLRGDGLKGEFLDVLLEERIKGLVATSDIAQVQQEKESLLVRH